MVIFRFFSPLETDILHKRSQAGEKGLWKGNFYTRSLGGSSEDCLDASEYSQRLLAYWTSTFGSAKHSYRTTLYYHLIPSLLHLLDL